MAGPLPTPRSSFALPSTQHGALESRYSNKHFKNEWKSQPFLTGSPKGYNTPAKGRHRFVPQFPHL